jgi:hypothetical protein
MNSQNIAKEPMHCYVCQNQTDVRCSYCLLPVCPEHGKQVQPWLTRWMVMACIPCQAKLEEIARQEQSLQWTAKAEWYTADLHALTSK